MDALYDEIDKIEESMKQEIRMMLLDFYYEKDRMRELDDYLLVLTPEDMALHDRKKIIRYMVIRGMYEEAYKWVRRFGPYHVDAKVLLKLCSRLLDACQIWSFAPIRLCHITPTLKMP